MLVSKVMQNLANGVEFGEKEVRAGPAPQQFLLLVSFGVTHIREPLLPRTNSLADGETNQEHMLRLNGFIRENLAKVEAFFEEIASESSTVRDLHHNLAQTAANYFFPYRSRTPSCRRRSSPSES